MSSKSSNQVTARNHPSLRYHDLWRKNGAYDVFSEPNIRYTYSGRAAIYQICRQLHDKRRIVLIPAFHCPTVVDPVLEAGLGVRFYNVKSDLSIDRSDFLAKLDDDVAAAIVINYFGFPCNIDDVKAACKSAGAVLIEDCAHSFLATNPLTLSGERGDVAIHSFKKLAPTMVGGAVRVNNESIAFPPSGGAPPIGDTVVNLKRMLDQIADNSSANVFSRLYRAADRIRVGAKSSTESSSKAAHDDAAERQLEFDYPFHKNLAGCRIPFYAKRVLSAAHLEKIADTRRRHFDLYLNAIEFSSAIEPVYASLPGNVCPWAFPVLLPNRSSLDIRMRSLGVPLFTFGETLHKSFHDLAQTEPRMYKNAVTLSSSILCFSVHQGLDSGDFSRYSQLITTVAQAGQTTYRSGDSR